MGYDDNIKKRLENNNPQVRIEAINELPRDMESVDLLIDALKDKNHLVRFKAAEKLIEMDELAIDKLISVLEKGEDEMRRYAAFALKKIGNPKVADNFIKALRDSDWGVRKTAARALGKLGDKRAVEPLINLLGDEDWGVKLAAVRSLGDLKDERAIEPIKKARRRGDKEFKKAANQALRKIQS